MEETLVTVIIPVYNAQETIGETLRSALKQTHRNLEILVIDDCSQDLTLRKVKEAVRGDKRVKVVHKKTNTGVAETRNTGLDMASGQYIAFLDADDLWRPEKLERQLCDMEVRKLDLGYTAYGFIKNDGRKIAKVYHVPKNLDYQLLLKENVIGCSSAVFRATVAENVRMLAQYAHEDYVFWLELVRNGALAGGVDEALMFYRLRDESRSANKKKAAVNRWLIYRNFLRFSLPRALALFVQYTVKAAIKHWRS